MLNARTQNKQTFEMDITSSIPGNI